MSAGYVRCMHRPPHATIWTGVRAAICRRKGHVATDVRRARVDDTADAFARSDIELVAEICGVFVGTGPILSSGDTGPLERQVLVEEGRGRPERVRRDVLQNRPDDRAAGLAALLSGQRPSWNQRSASTR